MSIIISKKVTGIENTIAYTTPKGVEVVDASLADKLVNSSFDYEITSKESEDSDAVTETRTIRARIAKKDLEVINPLHYKTVNGLQKKVARKTADYFCAYFKKDSDTGSRKNRDLIKSSIKELADEICRIAGYNPVGVTDKDVKIFLAGINQEVTDKATLKLKGNFNAIVYGVSRIIYRKLTNNAFTYNIPQWVINERVKDGLEKAGKGKIK